MPRTRSLAWSELKIGVLTIFAIVIVAITIFMLTGGKGFFWQRYSLKTRFSNVAGLKPGSPVRVAGKDGKVRIVPATPEKEREAEFIMIRDGLICFEGDADALRRSHDPYIQTFLS